MAEIEIRVTDIVTIDKTEYRVIGYKAGLFSLCEMNTKKLNILLYSANDLISWVQDGTAMIKKASSTNIVLPDLEIKEDFQKKKELLQVVIDEYGPMYIDLCGKAPKEVLKKEMHG